LSILRSFHLNNKIAIVTGAARGIGRAIAIGLAQAGADLFLVDRDSSEKTAKDIGKMGRRCGTDVLDISGMNKAIAKGVIDQCVAELGGFNILVNNAGIIRRSPALEFSEQDWQQVLDINLNSVFFLSQAAAMYFVGKKQAGKIINLASMLSFQGGLNVTSYTAAKSAIMGLTRALGNEWAYHSINVNAIAPGYFITDVTNGIRENPERNQAILERIPAGRWGEPEDIKGTVVFLASAASDYIQGSVIPVDGGWLAR
jgi:2-deoxy-D-gluconate 3-dehydrogenase